MDKKALQKKLNKPYSTDNWKEVVQFVFPNVQIFDPIQKIPIAEKHQNIVESFNQLGNVQLIDGKILTLLELKLKDKVDILRNRVQLNEIVSSVIDTEKANGVLSVFEKGTDDYRFSFVARSFEFSEEGDLVENKTHAKRFTYILGKNESCKTPALQFFELSNNKDKADMNAIIKAFNITKLNNDFFDEYKNIYNNIVEFFTGKRLVKTGGKWVEKITSKPDKQLTYIFKNNELEARNFVKMLLGRLVFLKFVQKKGWLGVDKNNPKWTNGNVRFLEDAYEKFEHKSIFYSTFLSPLFFDALNNANRKDDVFELTDSKVPYLSGGLFDEDNLKTKEINIPQKHFDDIFDFLDRYNFTIDENVDIDDKNEFSIDPEMLGHIFENLLEDNKEKGAFYTPKEIVRYMCQESLKEYLKTSLENNEQWPTDETEAVDFEKALHNFVTKKEAGGIIEFEKTIAKALKDVKICDPAIGSGAFPMGLLNEIFQLVHKLHSESGDKKYQIEEIWDIKGWQPNIIKQNIIQNSIYGVDIEEGAVDVARLRFWLSLIVDEPEPKALPHLDYKIVVGNSLVSKLNDTIIDIDWEIKEEQSDLFGAELTKERAQILDAISQKQKAVFDPQSDEEQLSLEIRNLKIDLLCKQLELMIEHQNIPVAPKITDYKNKTKIKFIEDQNLYLETLGWKKQIEKLKKLKKQPEAPLHFFDWKLDFPEIMNEEVTEKVGFDIVIGNPPYVSFFSRQAVKVDEKYLESLKNNSEFIKDKTKKGRYHTVQFFLDREIKFLKKEAILFNIIDISFFEKAFNELRGFLLREVAINEIIANLNVFENVASGQLILSFKNTKPNANHQVKWKDNFNEIFIEIPQNLWANDSSNVISVPKNELIETIETGCNSLITYCDVKVGVNIGGVKDYFMKSDPKYYPFINGSNNVQLYKIIFPSDKQYKDGLMYFDFNKKVEKGIWDKGIGTPSIGETNDRFLKPKLVIRQSDTRLTATYDENTYHCDYNLFTANKLASSTLDLKYILSIINSKLMTYYVLEKGYLNIKSGKTPQIRVTDIKELPIKSIKNQLQFINLVEKILIGKENDEDCSIFEQQIDNLVYKLYELSYEEVLVVEPEFSERMSREKYEKLKVE